MDCALGGSAKVYELLPYGLEKIDVLAFFEGKKSAILSILKQELKDNKGIKWYLTLHAVFVKTLSTGEEAKSYPFFRNFCLQSIHKSTLKKQLRSAYSQILKRFAEWVRDGSGWVLDRVIKMHVHVAKYKPFKGSSFLELPPKLKRKRALLNVQNDDNFCFVWSILAALHPNKHNPNRVSVYKKHFKTLNLKQLNFPLPVNQISKFESQNGIPVNVFQYAKEEIFPLHISKLSTATQNNTINLLLIKKGNKSHYCWIKSLSRLLCSQGKYTNKRHYCYYCLHAFTRVELLEKHVDLCRKQGFQKVILPTEDNKWLEFSNYHKQDKIKFVVYCDFESLLRPIKTCSGNPSKSFTLQTHKHVPCAYSYVVVSTHSEYTKKPVVYRGPNAVEHFIKALLKEQEDILDVLYRYLPLKMTENDWDVFLNSDICHICGKKVKEGDLRVRDHEHTSSRFRGLAHAQCNLKFKMSKKIPVVLHNLKNYDSHLILQGMRAVDKECKIKCIANNMEKYVTFSIGPHLTFIDSYQFLASSLDQLVTNLAKEGASKFSILTDVIHDIEPHLLLRKQVYPYSYIDSFEKFNEKELPPKEKYYSDLTESEITDDDYMHAKTMWARVGMASIGDMCNFYVLTDALLLACVMENFRALSLQYYKLDPLHYVSLPGLTFDACLKYTGVKLELLTDPDKYLFFEAGIRGGISVISHRYARANNPHVEGYNPSKPDSYIMLYDSNALYSWALCQPLPRCNFQWLSKEDIESIDINALCGEGQKGYVFEVDLKYPAKLHDLHNLYPLAPERMTVSKRMLSPYLKRTLKKHGIQYSGNTPKLVPNLSDKTNYIVHYKTLQTYLELGLEVTKVHRVLSFHEEAWAKPYVTFNIEKRKLSQTKFEQDMFKLMNNSFFGKTMENVRKRKDIELVTQRKVFQKMAAKVNFDAFRVFNKHLVGVNMKKQKVFLNKPIYTGFAILDLSKVPMYKFHYGHIVVEYGDNVVLLFTDTDSLCYLIIGKDVYQRMLKHLTQYDTSNYPLSHFLFSDERKREMGKFKDEMGGKPIIEFVGLRPKLYSIMTAEENKKTAKGIKKTTIRKHLRHSEYKQSLFNARRYTHKMKSIQSKNHELFTVTINKTSLCPLDDKRYICDDGISSLAYGHYKLRKATAH